MTEHILDVFSLPLVGGIASPSHMAGSLMNPRWSNKVRGLSKWFGRVSIEIKSVGCFLKSFLFFNVIIIWLLTQSPALQPLLIHGRSKRFFWHYREYPAKRQLQIIVILKWSLSWDAVREKIKLGHSINVFLFVCTKQLCFSLSACFFKKLYFDFCVFQCFCFVLFFWLFWPPQCT